MTELSQIDPESLEVKNEVKRSYGAEITLIMIKQLHFRWSNITVSR